MPRAVAQDEEFESRGWFGRGWTSASGFLLGLVALAAVSLGLLFAWISFENYVGKSPRFRFRMARMAGEADNLRIRGVNRASLGEIRHVFDADQGASLYHLPISDRREDILKVKWVRDAAVIRRWPDGVDVVVHERQPVAFVQLPRRRSDPPALMLIDEAGELLPIPERRDFQLPVLLGLASDQPAEERAARVRLMNYFLKDIATAGMKVADIDVGDPRNLKCRVTLDGRSVLLLMGPDDFAANLRRLMNHWMEIQQRMPQAKVLDLRVAEHITAADGVALDGLGDSRPEHRGGAR